MPHSWSRPKTEADHPECAPLRGIAGLLVLHDDYKQKVLEEVQRVEEDNLVAHLVEEMFNVHVRHGLVRSHTLSYGKNDGSEFRRRIERQER